MLVDAAGDVVIIQRGFIKQQAQDIERLRAALVRAEARIEELEAREEAQGELITRLQERIRKLENGTVK
jgi:hypothetical protein